MFLDSDDALASGSLRRIHDRILETDKPDVLVFDYARWYEDGTQQRNPLHELVGEASRHGVFNLVERPNLLDLFNSACSKAYRREFTESHAMTFPTGYYEDIPWTMVALMAAERIAALDAVVLLYRQRLAGSILRSRSRRHFDVFAQWELVFRYLDHHPECEIHRQRLYTFMISQFDAMLVTHARVPDDARAEFFHLAVSVCHANRPEPWVRHIRPTEYLKGGQLRLTALDRGNFALFEGIARSKPLVDRGKEVVRRLAAGRSRSQSTADEDSGRA
jgi:hypothetical protein